MQMPSEHPGPDIEQWRINLGLTAAEAARRADMSVIHWRRVEKGEIRFPEWLTIVRMYRALGLNIGVTFRQPEREVNLHTLAGAPHE